MNPADFRKLFPALRAFTWLDTPGSPPGAAPVVQALGETVEAWSTGVFDWLAWDAATSEARSLFANWIGVEADTVSTMGSLAEAAATVAASLPQGRVVVAAEDFRSNLFPWMARRDVVPVPARGGRTCTEDLIEALDERSVLLAVSEVTSKDGQRLDLAALRAATERVGARLFVNLTQSLGALRFDVAAVRPDYLAVHGYKWMLCPRGAAWLVSREDRLAELKPLAPNWKSAGPPHGFFGGALNLPDVGGRLDSSPAWFSWIGACAALRLLRELDPIQVEQHCLGLANQLVERAGDLGFRPVVEGNLSHIVVLQTDQAEALSNRLLEKGVRATALGDRIRFGFHYFNDDQDVQRLIAALSG
ncbi:aminotransferase class V-fold PLP-dependent enzyme [Streptomyces violaceusniger]|uniref:aminotransferase class V-fold PLP-dependent enzyme n=1 Tax=Streptomyces violaceusniger TaxID=68280 RepID=UPI003812FE71